MPTGWKNMDDGSQGFFYQPDLLYGVEPNDTGMGNDNDENMGGDDIDMQLQPNYLDFSSYFITNEVYFMTFICLCFVKHCVLLLRDFFILLGFSSDDLLNLAQRVRKEHRFVVMIQKSR